MSELCEACPTRGGALIGRQTKWAVCGSPTAQCEDYRNDTLAKLQAWMRLGDVAMLARGGGLDMRSLRPGDGMELIFSTVDEGYGDGLSYLEVNVESIAPSGLVVARMIKDEYHAEGEIEGRPWPIPKGEQIEIVGSSHNGDDAVPGFLHIGRQVDLTRDPTKFTVEECLQEIILTDPSGILITVWDTDPGIFRPPDYRPGNR